MLVRPSLLLCLGFTGCTCTGHEDPGGASPAPATPPPQEVPAASESTQNRVTAAVATFIGDHVLEECDEFVVTLPPGVDAGALALDKLVDSIKVGRNGGASRLDKPCAEQFPSDPVLATCVASTEIKGDQGVVKRAFTGRYYGLEAIVQNSDVYMKSCVDMNGEWHVASHDSKEWREAHVAWAQREGERFQKTSDE
jgi:hypothetical protein